MSKYNQLNREQRCKISYLYKQNKSFSEIAHEVGVHKSTISREIKCNSGKHSYSEKYVQMLANEPKEWRRYKIKFTPKIK